MDYNVHAAVIGYNYATTQHRRTTASWNNKALPTLHASQFKYAGCFTRLVSPFYRLSKQNKQQNNQDS